MLDILGWQFDRAGPKSDDFSENVSALGVRFDLSESGMGSLKVHNTEKKVEDTTLLLENVVQADKLAKKDALVLRGKLAFCDAFIFGRVGKLALQDLTKHAYASPFISKFSERLVVSLILLRSRLLTGQPRLLTCEMLDTFFFHFHDASFSKENGGGFGAFLAAQDGRILSRFSLRVDASRFKDWFEQGRQNLI